MNGLGEVGRITPFLLSAPRSDICQGDKE